MTLQTSDHQQLRLAIGEARARDYPALVRLWRQLERSAGDAVAQGKNREKFETRLEASMAWCQRRAASRPLISYPPELPVSARREDILSSLAAHQVVILAGDTGSGKSTQLPKLCLEAGLGVRGQIGMTQPRRIAARAIADFVAGDLGCELGTQVGYRVRFDERVSADSLVKVMTDGMLLAETQSDRFLSGYDALIIDEAHERSLNIDFLLGFLHRLLPRRPDLKLIITSATIDTARIAAHFKNAAVVEVEGRTYPVETVYRLPDGDNKRNSEISSQVAEAVWAERRQLDLGDMLVFSSGEREIGEICGALEKLELPNTEVLPLYARLSGAAQSHIFKPGSKRRIVVTTNVAETSLTVPRIRAVIDPGLARISRYSPHSRIQRLPVEPISRASADQRRGRCGRIGPGRCIRLYEQADYLARPEFTEPEIQRSALSGVILRMLDLGLGDVDDFPFVDPPDSRQIRDGYRLLSELGALDSDGRLTEIGRQLARFPLDPRLGRMLLAGAELGALDELLTIAAVLSIQDPRERPLDQSGAADQARARFQKSPSDFLALLQLWHAWHEEAKGSSARRRWCQQHFLSARRMREWAELRRQLAEQCAGLKLKLNATAAEPETIHRALLVGLLSHIGMLTDQGDYLGARSSRFQIFPGSALKKRKPGWLMAWELVETGRVYARVVAPIDPAWVEPLAGPLLRRSYGEPYWSRKRGQVMAKERVTLFGLPLVRERPVAYAGIDLGVARQVFLQSGLVQGELNTRGQFLAHNLALVEEIEALEHRLRRADVRVDDETIRRFYHERIPQDIVTGLSFEQWRKKSEKTDARRLFLSKALLIAQAPTAEETTALPDVLSWREARFPIEYRFEPGHPEDGPTLVVPRAAVGQLGELPLEWLVPGLLAERIHILFKALPKSARVRLIPLRESAEQCAAEVDPEQGRLLPVLAGWLQQRHGLRVDPADWRATELPAHLTFNLRVVDDDGAEVCQGRDPESLMRQLADGDGGRTSASGPERYRRSGVTEWDFGTLPERISFRQGGAEILAYPVLRDAGTTVELALAESEQAAAQIHRQGVQRLLALKLPGERRHVRRLTKGLATLPFAKLLGPGRVLGEEVLGAAIDRALLADGVPRTLQQFEAALQRGGNLARVATDLCDQLTGMSGALEVVQKSLRGLGAKQGAVVQDVEAQLKALFMPNFLAETPSRWLDRYPKYLEAIRLRLERLPQSGDREQARMSQFDELSRPCQQWLLREAGAGPVPDAVQRYRWLLEEFRLSLYAQPMKTLEPVSPKRLEKIWAEVRRELA
ncbi:MAG: ATP-dependent RNA helicase HrpA [Gammaproteobacteria bacterium]|nr:ATP-dependent RNA helicase HrpA [Gammaproteobacteria bacterium]